jgi:hypothetical protein
MSITDHPHNTGPNESHAIIVPPSRPAERCRSGFLLHVASSIVPSPFSRRTPRRHPRPPACFFKLGRLGENRFPINANLSDAPK